MRRTTGTRTEIEEQVQPDHQCIPTSSLISLRVPIEWFCSTMRPSRLRVISATCSSSVFPVRFDRNSISTTRRRHVKKRRHRAEELTESVLADELAAPRQCRCFSDHTGVVEQPEQRVHVALVQSPHVGPVTARYDSATRGWSRTGPAMSSK